MHGERGSIESMKRAFAWRGTWLRARHASAWAAMAAAAACVVWLMSATPDLPTLELGAILLAALAGEALALRTHHLAHEWGEPETWDDYVGALARDVRLSAERREWLCGALGLGIFGLVAVDVSMWLHGSAPATMGWLMGAEGGALALCALALFVAWPRSLSSDERTLAVLRAA